MAAISGILTSGDIVAKGKSSNFGGKKAAPFAAKGKRKQTSKNTAKGTPRKVRRKG